MSFDGMQSPDHAAAAVAALAVVALALKTYVVSWTATHPHGSTGRPSLPSWLKRMHRP